MMHGQTGEIKKPSGKPADRSDRLKIMGRLARRWSGLLFSECGVGVQDIETVGVGEIDCAIEEQFCVFFGSSKEEGAR